MADVASTRTPEALARVESRLHWLVGSPRTGSTWVLRMLIHPWRLSETASTAMARPPLGRGPNVVPIDESFIPQRLVALGTPPFSSAGTADPESFLQHTRQRANPSYWLSDAYEEAWRPAVRELVLARLGAQADAAARTHGLSDPPIVVKEPNGSQGAPFVRSLLPRSKLAFLLRDGRDVVDSMLAASAPDGWLGSRPGARAVSGPEERRRFIREQAELWLVRTGLVQRAYDATPEGQRIMIRYEEMLSEPQTQLRRLGEWIGIERSPREIAAAVAANRFGSLRSRLLRKRRGARAATPGTWRTTMSAAEQGLLHEALGPKLAELGYSVQA